MQPRNLALIDSHANAKILIKDFHVDITRRENMKKFTRKIY